MRRAHKPQLACEKCYAPMDLLENVPVLQSLEGQAIFECECCGNITLVRNHEPLRTASWVGSLPADCRISFAAL